MKASKPFYMVMLLYVVLGIFPNHAYCNNLSDTTKFTTLTIRVDNYVGAQKLELDSMKYENSLGQKFKISRFNYFMSNFVLTMNNGKEFVVPQDSSYFVIKQNDSISRTISIKVPEGKYQSFRFTLGVDSLRNTMDLANRKGALDPAGGMNEGMYWSWNSGYIFFKMEGESPDVPLDKTGHRKFRFHIGGFGGYNKPSLNNIKIVSLNFKRSGLKTSLKHASLINIKADIIKVIDGKTRVDLAKNASVMFGSFSSTIAQNYQEMFSIISTNKNE